MIESGWGARDIDPATWQRPSARKVPSIWGHDRAWLAPAQRAEARAMRLANAERGLRRPVQVLPGNHEVMDRRVPVVRRNEEAAEAGVARPSRNDLTSVPAPHSPSNRAVDR